jgi:hypothetical protein
MSARCDELFRLRLRLRGPGGLWRRLRRVRGVLCPSSSGWLFSGSKGRDEELRARLPPEGHWCLRSRRNRSVLRSLALRLRRWVPSLRPRLREPQSSRVEHVVLSSRFGFTSPRARFYLQ